MNALLFLALRAAHVFLAAVWIGSTVFVSALMMPAVEAAGPSGNQLLVRMNRRGMHAYMAVLGATTVLTGLYLLWHFTGGFDASVTTSHAGLAFAVGGASGVLAGIVGGAVVGRSAARIGSMMKDAPPDSPPSASTLQQIMNLRHTMKIGTRAVIALQSIALVLMAVGHYV